MRHLIPSLMLLATCSPTAAATLHVCPDGSGEYPNLHAAVAAAVSGDVIELCDGVFSGEENVDVDVGTKSLTFRSLHGSEATTIDVGIRGGPDDEYLPHMGFLLGSGATYLEGLTIIHAVGDTYQDPDGAAIRCVGGALFLRDVHVRDTAYGQLVGRGAGVFIRDGSLDVLDCHFEANRADREGGAIYAEDSWISLRGSTFVGNGSCGESAVWFNAGGVIEDCVLERSSGPSCENAPTGNALKIPSGVVSIRRTRFTDNVTRFGGCAQIHGAATVTFEDCIIEGAVGESGGALHSYGVLTLRNCLFRNNWSQWTGGALTGGGPMTLEGCVFHDNSCHEAPYRGNGAGAITLTAPATLVVRHCTFVRNGLRAGSAIALSAGSSLTVESSIFAFGGEAGSDVGPVYCQGQLAELSVRCTDVFGNAGGDWIGCLEGRESGEGNLGADPLFCDAGTGQFGLRPASPCAPEQAGECGGIGALGVACGTTVVEPVSWAAVKALFR